MARPALEVADILSEHGDAFLARHPLCRDQIKVVSAIRACRTAGLGGHVARCDGCDHTRIAYNSCRNRHCPKCQGNTAKDWLADSQADLLPVPYFHLVFTIPAPIACIAFQNKAAVYDLLFGRRHRRSSPSRPTRSISARASGRPPCCTRGDRR